MLCGSFERVSCLPAPASDPDTGPTGGIITQESEGSAALWGGEGLKHRVMEKTRRARLQMKNRLMHRIYRPGR